MKNLEDYELAELKLIYRILQSQLTEHVELMDSDLLHELQTFLQRQATRDGVDVSMHAQWNAWLGGGADLRAS